MKIINSKFGGSFLPSFRSNAIHLIESINRSCCRNYMRATNNNSSSSPEPWSSSVSVDDGFARTKSSSVLASTRTMAKIALENWHISRMHNTSPSSDAIFNRVLCVNRISAGKLTFRFARFVSNDPILFRLSSVNNGARILMPKLLINHYQC